MRYKTVLNITFISHFQTRKVTESVASQFAKRFCKPANMETITSIRIELESENKITQFFNALSLSCSGFGFEFCLVKMLPRLPIKPNEIPSVYLLSH